MARLTQRAEGKECKVNRRFKVMVKLNLHIGYCGGDTCPMRTWEVEVKVQVRDRVRGRGRGRVGDGGRCGRRQVGWRQVGWR